uniref:(northern house mosquito) hypothetical protein n=1 Tax=Culex pipiens TaxID=7175 RepID=A0A8D8G109_CULPI
MDVWPKKRPVKTEHATEFDSFLHRTLPERPVDAVHVHRRSPQVEEGLLVLPKNVQAADKKTRRMKKRPAISSRRIRTRIAQRFDFQRKIFFVCGGCCVLLRQKCKLSVTLR